MSPEAMPALRGRYAWPSTTETVKLEVSTAPNSPSMTKARRPPVWRKSKPKGIAATNTHCMNGRGPHPRQARPRPPPARGGAGRGGAEGARAEEDEQQRPDEPWVRVEDVDVIERHERREAERCPRADRHDQDQE